MRLSALLLFLSACAPRSSAPLREVRGAPAPREAPALSGTDAVAEAAVGRWLAVEVRGDRDATRDLRRGTLAKVLVVNPGGHVILRGVDGGAEAAFSGTLRGRIVTFRDLPGAALLSLEGTRLVFSDPSGRTTEYVRAAE